MFIAYTGSVFREHMSMSGLIAFIKLKINEALHSLHHMKRDRALIHMNIRMARGARRKEELRDDGLIFRAGTKADLKKIDEQHLKIYKVPILEWLRRVYSVCPEELIGVVETQDKELIGYDLFMFNESEVTQEIIHEWEVVIAPEYQGRGIATRLRRYSAESYNHGRLAGVSTLAGFSDVKALRTAQKAGFAITRASAKPPAHYLFKYLKKAQDS
ncbi:MAG TPA: hypothetical protein DCR21_05290 [Succinivibrionaceae bacterium]|nr:hypothetical protein [Succinivibrionaceae bacterium]